MRTRALPRQLLLVLGILAIAVAIAWAAGEPAWHIDADVAESCSCNPMCPCLFGSPATKKPCEGSRLIEIKAGHYGDVRLDGLAVVVTFRMGGWSKYYISDKASDEQVEAAVELVSHAFPSFEEWGVVTKEKVPLSVKRTDGRLEFSVPSANVDMKPMQGRDGKPVTVHNLPADFLDEYTQYVSEENGHKSSDVEFHYSGTNGFTSRLVAGNSSE